MLVPSQTKSQIFRDAKSLEILKETLLIFSGFSQGDKLSR